MNCKALLFDMDGGLVDSRTVVERTWRRWAARHGIDDEALLQVAHGAGGTSAGPELARRRLGAAGLPVPPVLVAVPL